ncbi:MAG: hypothetical protein ACOCZU_08355 [Planctomycetota bacterium]
MLYFALFPGRHDDRVNMEMLEAAPDSLPDLIPDAGRAAEAVRVIDTAGAWEGFRTSLNANPIDQRAVCYLTPNRS